MQSEPEILKAQFWCGIEREHGFERVRTLFIRDVTRGGAYRLVRVWTNKKLSEPMPDRVWYCNQSAKFLAAHPALGERELSAAFCLFRHVAFELTPEELFYFAPYLDRIECSLRLTEEPLNLKKVVVQTGPTHRQCCYGTTLIAHMKPQDYYEDEILEYIED